MATVASAVILFLMVRERAEELRIQGLQPAPLEVLARVQVVEEMVTAAGIQLIGFASGNVEELMHVFCSGRLPDPAFMMPGCCTGRRRFRGSRGQRCWQQ